MTIFLILVIVFCFGLLGFKMASYYINRKKFFYSFDILLNSTKADMTFTKDKLKYVIKRNSKDLSSKELCDLCENLSKKLDEKQSIEISDFDDLKILKKEEKEFLFQFFNGLGRFDVVSLSAELNGFESKVKQKCEETNDECKKYASLFIKLGIIVGILVCLLIV